MKRMGNAPGRMPALAIAGLMLAACAASAEITITAERRATNLATDGTFVFNNVPSNTSDDLANGKTFVVLAGSAHSVSGPISNLTNGPAQTNGDSLTESFFADGTSNIRVQLDLDAVVSIEQINSYSWHINTRAPQIYKVYGASAPSNNAPDFTDVAFQDDAAFASLGYTLIATVNTQPLGQAGQHGVSIAGEIGNHRYLLFDLAPPVWGVGPRPTFFGEIDVIGAPAVEAGSFKLAITPSTAPATGYDLEWESQSGKLYNLRTSTDLSGGIATWELVEGNIEATPPANTYNVEQDGPRRFYAVEEFDVPPPPPIFAADFEENDGGFTVLTLGGTAWEHGAPNSLSTGGGAVIGGSGGSANAWGTNLTGAYVAGTDTSLRSPPIDLAGVTGAELSFARSIDAPEGHTLEVNVIDAVTDTVIANIIPPMEDPDDTSSAWQVVGPIAIPAVALGQEVRIEWRFIGINVDTTYLGVYIDDVVVAPVPEVVITPFP